MQTQPELSRHIPSEATLYESAFNKIERDLRAEEGVANELVFAT